MPHVHVLTANVPLPCLPRAHVKIDGFHRGSFFEEVTNAHAQYTYRWLWDPMRGAIAQLLPIGVSSIVHECLYGQPQTDRTLSLPMIYCHTTQRLACATMARLMHTRSEFRRLQQEHRELQRKCRRLTLGNRQRPTQNRTSAVVARADAYAPLYMIADAPACEDNTEAGAEVCSEGGHGGYCVWECCEGGCCC